MKQYIVDAFTDKVFSGNPAAVCVMEDDLPSELMLKIAAENNLSETAFVRKEASGYRLRWFTPKSEIDLCGHATLATAFVILSFYEQDGDKVSFHTLSGLLEVKKEGELYKMDFPAYSLKPVDNLKELSEALGVRVLEAYISRDLLCILEDEETVCKFNPVVEKISALDGLLLHISAPGNNSDCVSRSFGPKIGIKEDPVCGSGHCHIVPYWADKLGKAQIYAIQASERGGKLYCTIQADRVVLAGKAVLFCEGRISDTQQISL